MNEGGTMKTYKNISDVEQLDIAPGETGEREIPETQETRMVERGAIEVVGAPAESPADQETPEKTPEEIEAEKKAAEEQAAAEQRGRGQRGRS
jgi:hypothetical protein